MQVRVDVNRTKLHEAGDVYHALYKAMDALRKAERVWLNGPKPFYDDLGATLERMRDELQEYTDALQWEWAYAIHQLRLKKGDKP